MPSSSTNNLCNLSGLQVWPHASSSDDNTGKKQKEKNQKSVRKDKERVNCLWPPYVKQFPFLVLSCFCLSIAPVVIFICTKEGETDSLSLMLPKWTD